MRTDPKPVNEISDAGFRLLPYAAAAVAITIVGLAAVGFGGVSFKAGDQAMGERYVELLQAVRSPGLHRLEMLFDGAGWLSIGVVLSLLAAATHPWSPGCAIVVAACGIGQLIGAQGGFERFVGISDLAAAYAAAGPSQQEEIARAYMTMFDTVQAHFHEGQLLQAVGFLVAAWGLSRVPGLPRWLAVVVGAPGVTSGLIWLGNSAIAGGVPFFPFVILHVMVFVLGANVVLAVAMRRRPRAIANP